MSIKVRFHLAAGENFRKWQVRKGNEVSFYSPNEVNILMVGCKLRNHLSIAKKIHEGANKEVCAWVECQSVEIKSKGEMQVDTSAPVSYNPRIAPHWVDSFGLNADDLCCPYVVSEGNRLYELADEHAD